MLVPLVDESSTDASAFVEQCLVVDCVFAFGGGDEVFLAQEDGLLGAGFFAHAAVDAAQHVNFKFARGFLLLGAGGVSTDFAGLNLDGARGADEFAKLAGNAAFASVITAYECGCTTIVIGQLAIPALLGIGHADTDAFAIEVFLGAAASNEGEYKVTQCADKPLGYLHDIDFISKAELGALDWFIGHVDRKVYLTK